MDSKPHAQLGDMGLYLLLAGQLLVMIDFSIVNVALEAIASSLHANQTQLVLVVACYGVAFAVCLAMGGRLGDNMGRRRAFALGVTIFSIASLLCGLSESVYMLLVSRGFQGIGAALAIPQILATIHVSLRDQKHSRAIGLLAAVGGVAFVVGQVLGGALVSADFLGLGWRTVFLINPPIGILILCFLNKSVPETKGSNPANIDWAGTVLLALIVLSLLVPSALGPLANWPWYYPAIIGLAIPMLVALWLVEVRQEKSTAFPLLPPILLRLPSMRFAIMIAILLFTSFGGFMFSLALTLQSGAKFNSLQSGSSFIAIGIAFFVGSSLTAKIFKTFRKSTVLLAGCILQLLGLIGMIFTLHSVWPHPDVLRMAPSMLLVGFGSAFMVGCYFRIGLAEVPREHAGAGSAMLSTVQQSTLALGPSSFGAILAHTLSATRGDYLTAIIWTLSVEVFLMLLLLVAAILYRSHETALKFTPAGVS